MKHRSYFMFALQLQCACLLGLIAFSARAVTEPAPSVPSNAPFLWDQIGARAGAEYQGDGLAVTPKPEGASLRCVFQRMEGEVTSEGFWLTSTVTNQSNDRFKVTAVQVGRVTPCAPNSAAESFNLQPATPNTELPATGRVFVDGQTVRFTRPGLVEEYTVSMDGVRQEFIVLEKAGGASLPESWSAKHGLHLQRPRSL